MGGEDEIKWSRFSETEGERAKNKERKEKATAEREISGAGFQKRRKLDFCERRSKRHDFSYAKGTYIFENARQSS